VPKDDPTLVMGMSKQALLSGAPTLTPTAINWHVAPWCEAPVLSQRSHLQVRNPDGTYVNGRELNIFAACRKCAGCLRHRANDWFGRMMRELSIAHTTYMVTLTLRPEARYQIEALARQSLRDPLAGEPVFKDRARALVRELQLYVKRCRSHQPPLRYVWVIEPHKDGQPHVHILWHLSVPPSEYKCDTEGYPLFLRTQWRLGFTTMRIVAHDSKEAGGYVAKYLSKESGCAVRASQKYGEVNAPLDAFKSRRYWPRKADNTIPTPRKIDHLENEGDM